MEQIINQIIEFLTSMMGQFGFISGFLLIVLESILPILPLAVFIALNVITYGTFWGFIMSWLATVCGCMLSFYISRKLSEKFEKKYSKNKSIKKVKKYINKLSYSNLVILFALPFTPAFALNIGAGLSDIDAKKFFSAVMIGKLPMVYFWGFIGKSFLESLSDPYTLFQITVLVIGAYLVSKIINRIFN